VEKVLVAARVLVPVVEAALKVDRQAVSALTITEFVSPRLMAIHLCQVCNFIILC
jgi:hypothetical protein